MADETKTEKNGGWTLDTLHHLMVQTNEQMELRYQERFNAQQQAVGAALLAAREAVTTALASADRAVAKAENAAEQRFESVNEFRATLADQASNLLTRSEADARFTATTDKLTLLMTQIGIYVRRDEHDTLAANIAKIELELKGTAAIGVRREDLKSMQDAIEKLRDNQSASAGKSLAFSGIVTTGVAILAIVVAIGVAVWSGGRAPPVLSVAQTSIDQKLDAVSRQLELNHDLFLRQPSPTPSH
jgi:hypothetical protein